jgi:hypothetical protein
VSSISASTTTGWRGPRRGGDGRCTCVLVARVAGRVAGCRALSPATRSSVQRSPECARGTQNDAPGAAPTAKWKPGPGPPGTAAPCWSRRWWRRRRLVCAQPSQAFPASGPNVVPSDLDAADRRRLMGRIRTAIKAPVPIEVLVAEVSEFETGKDVNGSPYYWPARDGRVVYDRGLNSCSSGSRSRCPAFRPNRTASPAPRVGPVTLRRERPRGAEPVDDRRSVPSGPARFRSVDDRGIAGSSFAGPGRRDHGSGGRCPTRCLARTHQKLALGGEGPGAAVVADGDGRVTRGGARRSWSRGPSWSCRGWGCCSGGHGAGAAVQRRAGRWWSRSNAVMCATWKARLTTIQRRSDVRPPSPWDADARRAVTSGLPAHR